jgi:CDP-glycerol glycerophosphotransferase (TagB/SpsB family)
MIPKRAFIIADHGLSLVYFLQTKVHEVLHANDIEIVLFTDDDLVERVRERFQLSGLIVEGMRLERVRAYAKKSRAIQWWLGFLRRVGGSNRINTAAMDSYVEQVIVEAHLWQLPFLPIALFLVWLLKRSARARTALVRYQQKFTPQIYADLFEQYKPDIVIASTPGWREDRYLLREAIARGVDAASIILGWDNPSSYSIPGAPVDHITCWSEIQKEELVLGSDWDTNKIHIGGIPIYDGYFEKRWILPRNEYFEMHGLDPERKLLSYACSFVSFSPNYQNIEALVDLVSSDELSEPSQLLVRLHPNHFWDNWLFEDERKRIYALAEDHSYVHVVEPVPIGGELGHYSGEDMPEKSSMMAHADVFLTVYSTMVVEAAIHDRPIISVCIDAPRGWGYVRKMPLRKYSLPLSNIGDWPTHDRFRESGAGRVVFDKDQLRKAVNDYLNNPALDSEARASFVRREVTYTDGSAGIRTGKFLASLVSGSDT